ncbi:hypothetical protein COV18_01330 [Candidatus Woesearchaeota archaeon CG10_big_fil_rev_8_21_14_0_10_37_12]|nr:MAG: hypothetical protein COV18_01330 [Candidatus Woesearchaeota archaeon CG10_big_fil_rev_8_21_14_0_10_37_12]
MTNLTELTVAQLKERIREKGWRIWELPPKDERPKPMMDLAITVCHSICEAAFEKPFPYEGIDGRNREADSTMIFSRDGTGFVAYTVNNRVDLEDGTCVNYMNTAMIVPSERGNGLYDLLNALRAKVILDAEVLITRTQNPRVFAGMRRLCDARGYKLHHGAAYSSRARKLVNGVAARMEHPETDEYLVQRGVYLGRELK